MIVAGSKFTALDAPLHVYIVYMESIAWTSNKVRATFGASEDETVAMKETAFNQGFCNLFLGIVTAVGIACVLAGATSAGGALLLAGAGSMLAAALVLFLSSPDKRRAAVAQGVFPLIAAVLLAKEFLLSGLTPPVLLGPGSIRSRDAPFLTRCTLLHRAKRRISCRAGHLVQRGSYRASTQVNAGDVAKK